MLFSVTEVDLPWGWIKVSKIYWHKEIKCKKCLVISSIDCKNILIKVYVFPGNKENETHRNIYRSHNFNNLEMLQTSKNVSLPSQPKIQTGSLHGKRHLYKFPLRDQKSYQLRRWQEAHRKRKMWGRMGEFKGSLQNLVLSISILWHRSKIGGHIIEKWQITDEQVISMKQMKYKTSVWRKMIDYK